MPAVGDADRKQARIASRVCSATRGWKGRISTPSPRAAISAKPSSTALPTPALASAAAIEDCDASTATVSGRPACSKALVQQDPHGLVGRHADQRLILKVACHQPVTGGQRMAGRQHAAQLDLVEIAQQHAGICQSAMLVQRQGLVAEDNSLGDLLTLGPVLRMSQTPPRWDRPTPVLGGDAPEWLPRD